MDRRLPAYAQHRAEELYGKKYPGGHGPMQTIHAGVLTQATAFGVGDNFNGGRVREFDTSPEREKPPHPWRRWKP